MNNVQKHSCINIPSSYHIYIFFFWSKMINSTEHQIIHVGNTEFQHNTENWQALCTLPSCHMSFSCQFPINYIAISCKSYFSLVCKIKKLGDSSMAYHMTVENAVSVHKVWDFRGGHETYFGHQGIVITQKTNHHIVNVQS